MVGVARLRKEDAVGMLTPDMRRTVERATPVTSPAYDLGATEDELRAIYRERLLS